MFKAIHVPRLGLNVTVDEQIAAKWLDALYDFITTHQSYRSIYTYPEVGVRKRSVFFIDPYVNEARYNDLTSIGLTFYAGCLTGFWEWLDSALNYLGVDRKTIDATKIAELQDSILRELLSDKSLKERVKTFAEELDHGFKAIHNERLKVLMHSLIMQASEDNLNVIFFTNAKNELWYELAGNLYRIKADATDATIKDPKCLIAKEIVDFY